MAGGNMGDLFVSLGIKDEMSKTLEKIVKGMNGVDQATQDAKKRGEELLDSLNKINKNDFAKTFREANEYIEKNSKGIAGIVKSLGELGGKDLNALTGKFLNAGDLSKMANLLNAVSLKLREIAKSGDKDPDLMIQAWQNRVSNALKYIKLLQEVNTLEKKVGDTKAQNPNVNTKSLDDAKKSVIGLREEVVKLLQRGGVDDSNILGGFTKLLGIAKTEVGNIISAFKKENPLSSFSNGAAKVEADIARVTEKLAKLRDMMLEGAHKGYKTSMLPDSFLELEKILSRLNAAKLNPSMLTDAVQMKALISDVSLEFLKATIAAEAYNREKRKITDANKEYATAEKLSKKDHEAELKEMSDYVKRYMELQEAKRKADEKATKERQRQSDIEKRRIESDTARMSRLYASLGRGIGRGERAGMRGLEVGANTTALEKALSEAAELKRKIEEANVALMGKGGRTAYEWYAAQVNTLKTNLDNATQAQKELNSAQDKANREKVRKQAEELRKEAQAAKELRNEHKQLNRELEITRSRIQSTERALHNLQEKRFTSKMLGLDTGEADAKIKHLETQLMGLRNIMLGLQTGDVSFLGRVGNLGNGREVQAANNLASSYDKANKEAQRGVELEQKRQQEIVKSASKIRGDLVSALVGANAEASKMQSIMGDIKSLFLQGGIVFGAQQFFNSIVQTGGEIVQQHVALRSILGDVQKADKLFEQTQQLALQSPFKFGELNRDVKQLAAFGVEANDLYETTKRLADIASGLGVSFERLGLAYGQVKARSWLDGKELRQFAYAGLPLLQKITDLYNAEGKNGRTNYKNSDVKKMITNREVSFEDVQKVLWNMTNEGGQFYNMQFVLSETLLGKWNKLIDAWDIMLGKFADGKSLIGGTFKVAIDGATSFVLALDKMSPALLAFGAMFALRKGVGAISSKIGIASNIAMYQTELQTKLRTFAVEQHRLLIEGKITQEKFSQRIAEQQGFLNSRQNLKNTIEQAALEGRLSAIKLQKAYREKLISAEMVKQLELMGIISAKQSELIMKDGVRARVSLGANQLISKVGGFFSGWNLATIGVSVGMALYSGYKQFKDSIKQETERINETAKTNLETMSNLLSEVGSKGATGDLLQKQVDKMKDVLDQSGLYTESIKDQIARARDLSEEYDILKKKVTDVKEASSLNKGEAQMYAEAKKASGAGFIGGASWLGQWTGVGQDDIDKNIEDVGQSLAKLQLKLEKFSGSTRTKMNEVADSLLGARAAGMSFEQKLSTLFSENGINRKWAKFVFAVGKGKKDISNDLFNLEDDLRTFGADFGEITTDDIPKYLEYMAKSRNMSLNEFSKWCKEHPLKLESMLDQMLSTANEKVPGLVDKLREVALAILNIGKTQPKSNRPKVWKNPLKEGTVERTTFNNLFKNGKLSGGKNGFWQKEMAEFISTLNHGDSSGWYEFGEAVRKKYQEIRNENDSAKSAKQKQPFIRQQKMLEAIAEQNGIDLNVGKNKVTGNYGKDKKNTKDTELESLKRKIDLYKKFYSELEKYRDLYGRQGAFAQIKSEKEFQPIFKMGLSDPGTYGVSVGELLNRIKSNTEERADYKKSQIADIHAKNRSDEEARIKAQNSELGKQLDILTEQYDVYKKLYELTGDSRGASMVAFGHVQNGTIKDELKSQMSVAIQQHNNRAGTKYTADDVLNMTEADFNSKIGKDSENISVIYERWRNEVAKIKKESIDLMAELIQKNATIEQQIEDENRAYERQKKLIEESDTTSEMKQRALKGLDKNHNEAIGKLKFEQFKEQSDWVTIFDDLDRVSTNTINSMITGIEDFSKTTGLSVEVVKQLRKALDNLRKESIERNPFDALLGSTKRGNAIGSYLKGDLGEQYKNGDSYILTKEQAAKTGLQAGKKYTKADLENEQQGAYDDFQNGLTSLANKIKSLQDCLNPVIDLFAALGKEDTFLGQTTSIAGNALGAASQVSGGLKSLGLEKLGPYGAAAGAALSVITSLSAIHDKTLQKEIEASEARQKELGNMTKNIKSIIEDTLGGIYSYETSKDTKEQLRKVNSLNTPFRMKETYSEETYKAAKEAQSKPDSAYHAELASMMAQRDEIQNQRDAESKKKKKDSTKIADYNQQIKEMDQNIKTFAQDFLKDIYSIDFKSWASELTDTIISAWSKGEDAVEAYRDKVKDLMKDVVKNVISQKIIEAYMQKPLDTLTKTLEEKGQLDGSDILNLAKDMYNSAEGAAKTTTDVLDYLKSQGLDLSENGTSSSAKNSVKSITEETADILCSYVNAIRLDVSVIRTEQAKFYPEMSVIAKSQLTQLNTIAQNTLRNADAAERIERMFIEYNDNFNKVLNGTKSLKIK